MKTLIMVLVAGALTTTMAQAQSDEFQGIAGELPSVGAPDQEAGSRTTGFSFRIDRGRNRELEKATGVIPASQSQFYRPSILTGQRSRRTDGTGITIFNKLLDID
ncbi:MAG: hypothetical protein AB8B85_09730 [Paracoccaceae bacterium]